LAKRFKFNGLNKIRKILSFLDQFIGNHQLRHTQQSSIRMKPTHIIIVTIILFFKPVWSERTANFIEDLNYKEINEDVARQPPPGIRNSKI